MSFIRNIVFVGSGNVATHLAQAIHDAGLNILGFYSRKSESASILANKYNTKWGGLNEVNAETDLIIISVPDHAIKSVIEQLPVTKALVVHTSGSINMNILKEVSDRIGVFYPLQTFSKKKKLSYSNIPIMIESARKDDENSMENLARLITKKVYRINSAQRKKIHIAAIFSSNFTNYLFHIAADLLNKEDIPFDVIQPLIAETVEKLKELHPYHAQTGPAVRNDHQTMDSHLEDLKEIPEYHDIYKLMSHHIIKSRKK